MDKKPFEMKEWLKNNIVSTLTFATILGGVFYSAELKQLLFSSPQIKYKTEEHIANIDDLKLYRDRQRDSIEEARRRAFQDSIDRARDTLTKRNAVTTYQNKQRLDSVASMIQELSKKIDHTLEHIDQ